jgi:exopolyphosphatase/guanosine-5'-triphosphate,3'-diphosphate pyrophosphatase
MKRVAILDLGTNTFNLLIAEKGNSPSLKVLVNKKYPVKLGEGKINKGEIANSAIKRGQSAINAYYLIIKDLNVDFIQAFGTSAPRTSKNGYILLDEIREKTGIEVEIISGDREAELIYKGVRQTLSFNSEKFLILDIGGGSNELIIADMNKIFWKKSYPLGIARLLEKFKPGDPITDFDIRSINEYLAESLDELFYQLRQHEINILIGASGSFETFVTMTQELDINETECVLEHNSNKITLSELNQLNEKLIRSTIEERKKMKGLELMRVEMIVLASLFVNFMLENHKFYMIVQSNFALKEGAAYEQLNK